MCTYYNSCLPQPQNSDMQAEMPSLTSAICIYNSCLLQLQNVDMQTELLSLTSAMCVHYNSHLPHSLKSSAAQAELLSLTSAMCVQYNSHLPHSLKSSATQAELLSLTSATCVRILSTRASKAEVLKVCCWASCWMSLVNSTSLSFMNWPGWHAAHQIHPTFKNVA